MDAYPIGFEEDDRLRSAFIRDITLQQLDRPTILQPGNLTLSPLIPKRLIRYWHDQHNVPEDVRVCLNSWDRLGEAGFEIRMFNDSSAAEYIADRYGGREREAFLRCRHPAMRCDYFRMCILLAEGGLYVDADDVLVGEGWSYIFHDGALKVQPLCYDIPSSGMVPAHKIWQTDLPTNGRIFYVNNDPIAAPANHPVLGRALARATERLTVEDRFPEIQSTTGPGNFTAALAAHARNLMIAGEPFDFELLRDWEAIAETRWELCFGRGGDIAPGRGGGVKIERAEGGYADGVKRFARVLRGEPFDEARDDCMRPEFAGEFEPVLRLAQVVRVTAHGADAFGAARFEGADAGRVIRWGHGFSVQG